MYDGEFQDNAINGFGKMTFSRNDDSNRDYYVGKFKDWKRSGNGKMAWLDGEYYDGEWKDGLRHGRGTQFRADGSIIYQGQWIDDKQED